MVEGGEGGAGQWGTAGNYRNYRGARTAGHLKRDKTGLRVYKMVTLTRKSAHFEL